MSQAQSFAASDLPGSPPSSALDAAGQPSGAPTRSPALAVPPLGSPRAPWIAAALALLPGLGNVYNGSYARGVAFFLAVMGAINLANHDQDVFGFAVAFLWFFNVIDAYREARLIRAGLASDRDAAKLRQPAGAAEGFGFGALLVALGLLSLLAGFGYDLEWLFDLWPLGLMAAGAWFITAAILRLRAQRKAASSVAPAA